MKNTVGYAHRFLKYTSGKSLGNLGCLSNTHMGSFLVNIRQNLVFIAIIKARTVGLAAGTSLSGFFFPRFFYFVSHFKSFWDAFFVSSSFWKAN